MSIDNLIPLHKLCSCYKIEMSFFENLNEFGLIEIKTIEESLYIQQDRVPDIEKMIRLHQELDINFEGIDTVFNLLEKINELQCELISTRNKLKIYENQ